MNRTTRIRVPDVTETFDLAADLPQCRAAMQALLIQMELPKKWSNWLRRRYDDPALPYHGAAHVGLLWLRYLAHGGRQDDLGMALAVMFHDAVFVAGASDNESRSAALLRAAAGSGADADWAATAILVTTDHLDYAGGDPRTLRMLDLDLTPLAEHSAIFAQNTIVLRSEAAHLSDAEWTDGQRCFMEGMLARAPVFRSGLGDIYEAPALRNIEDVANRLGRAALKPSTQSE